ncbi:MAG: phosphate regulon transcriptional regulatory protein PhoB [Xanthomonadales bacterium]|nr:phosphate regulon transcriptional regulatory protein PhoB [Xanthomonadales bacterium]
MHVSQKNINKNINILVVDDEPAIREVIRFSLGKSGFQVQCAASGQEALAKIDAIKPDIVLLDWMMPNMSGPEITRRLRKDPVNSDIPIIMLTARVSEDDKVAGLNAGADDYVVKPFSPRELVARINALLRRTEPGDAEGKLRTGAITMDTVSRQVFFGQEAVHIGPTEYRMLEFLMSHENRAYSRSQLLDYVWGTNVFLEERTVDVHIRRLRKILQTAKLDHYIQTVRSHGYRFVASDRPAI